MKILIDTDILSMFAKAHAVATLVAFLGQAHVAMMPGYPRRDFGATTVRLHLSEGGIIAGSGGAVHGAGVAGI